MDIIFIASVEVVPTPKSQMFGKAKGGFTYCFIPANNRSEAKRELFEVLDKDGYTLKKLEYLCEYDGIEWDDVRLQQEYDEYARTAQLGSECIYAPFYTYSVDG